MYDDDTNPNFPPRRMGVAEIDFTEVEQQSDDTPRWLPLQPNLEGDDVSGSIKVSIKISKNSMASWQFFVVAAGILITSVSLFMGFYTWRSAPKPPSYRFSNP
jgi:hypothetical protein